LEKSNENQLLVELLTVAVGAACSAVLPPPRGWIRYPSGLGALVVRTQVVPLLHKVRSGRLL